MAKNGVTPPARGIHDEAELSATADAKPAGDAEECIVGIGASAGGLDVYRKLLEVLPADTGMAFILIQHLDPTHESMMVELLSSHTRLAVRQAVNGMPIAPDTLYLIPPGTYLAAREGALWLSAPQAPHGARLPFDFLLHSLAEAYGERAICVVLSGTGADGSLGLQAIHDGGGLVVVQEPTEAEYDGMPRNAILTGKVDRILRVVDIPKALIAHDRRSRTSQHPTRSGTDIGPTDGVARIIALLRDKTSQDFTLYKSGTLARRIERRMGLAGIERAYTQRYLEQLIVDDKELNLLAKDLLINVTSFFRDRNVFTHLEERCSPALIASHMGEMPIRLWCAGCSTGEEAYSLAMVFREAITAAKRNIKLQVFASDVDGDAVATAREGLYPEAIVSDVSPARLERFFAKEDHGFRVSPELRASVVFTVQDVLADPPFSRLDLVSCRNLLIYLGPEAQKKVLAAFHFALREGGILLLGSAETVGTSDARFAVISKLERLYRHIGPVRGGDLSLAGAKLGPSKTTSPRAARFTPAARQDALAELCRRMVLDAFAPATVLINAKNECLYVLGATHKYLRVASGNSTHDILAMAPQGLRTKLRSALQQAGVAKTRISIAGTRIEDSGRQVRFNIDVKPVLWDGEELRLICFLDEHVSQDRRQLVSPVPDVPRVVELERELEATRTELQGAIHNLEISGEEQKAVNEEALSINEEFQSTNEELLKSKEELQSLNEELTALNSQLQETLERQRTTANDLQNVLYSTDVATLFLDLDLNIRFFTPATKALFNVIATDIGRPLADLASLADDVALIADARRVLKTDIPIEQEIDTPMGSCFTRRVLPYRIHNGAVEGVVITFTDITERKRTRKALEIAKLEAERANAAKSRFLAAASHDLRQALQTLVLLQGLLAKSVEGAKSQQMLARLGDTVGAMSGMLNTLLDINQIEAGTVKPQLEDFPILDVLERLTGEFILHAKAGGLQLAMVRTSLCVRSDPLLLEQMLRNLLTNALKYTNKGRVLVGCRRAPGLVRIEVWDTGIGIAENQLTAIFDEYHQLGNEARERSQGLGLGLSIVQRLGQLLNLRVYVRSQLGKGSAFSIDVPAAKVKTNGKLSGKKPQPTDNAFAAHSNAGTILIVEDDPDVRDLLAMFLTGEGHGVAAVADGPQGLALLAKGQFAPDVLLVDYNLPLEMSGAAFVVEARATRDRAIGAIVLTGDVSPGTIAAISAADCTLLTKPIQLTELAQAVGAALRLTRVTRQGGVAPVHVQHHFKSAAGRVSIVDDDDRVRSALRAVLEDGGYRVADYADGETFLAGHATNPSQCVLVDAYLPGMSGLELLAKLVVTGEKTAAIMITGSSDVPIAVAAMKAGALDFVEKPIGADALLASVELALDRSRDIAQASADRDGATKKIATLTAREHEVMDLVLTGRASKIIAADLGISQRTVENHRAAIMAKTGSKSLPDLVRLALGSGPLAPATNQQTHRPSEDSDAMPITQVSR